MATTPAAASARKLRTESLLRRGRRLLYRRERPARYQNFPEPVEVHPWRHLGGLEETLTSLVDRHHPADRQPLGEDAVEPRRDDRVSDLHVLGALHVLEPAPAVDRALHDAPRPRPLHERVDPAVVIGDQEDARGVPAGEEDLTHDPLGRHRRRPLHDTVLLAAIDDERPREAGGIAADDPGGDDVPLQRLAEIEKAAESGVLDLELRLPVDRLLELLDTSPQRHVLVPRSHEIDGAPPGGDGGAVDGSSRSLEGGHDLEEESPEPVGARALPARPDREARGQQQAERRGQEDAVAADEVQVYRGPVRGSRTPSASVSALTLRLQPPRERLGNGDVLEQGELIQHLAGSHDHGSERIVGEHDRQTGLFAQQRIEVAEQRTAAGEHDALVDDIRGELGRGALETDAHGFHDLVDRLEQRIADLLVGDLDLLRHLADDVTTLDLYHLKLLARVPG